MFEYKLCSRSILLILALSFLVFSCTDTIDPSLKDTDPLQCEAPDFSIEAGSYSTDQTLSLNSDTDGASIYYTTDGSTPSSSSTLYTGAITLNASGTTEISAIAVKEDYTDSDISTGSYTLNYEVMPLDEDTTFANTVKLSWGAEQSAADGYQIQYSISETGLENNNYIELTSSTNSCELSGLIDSQTFYWRFRSVKSSSSSEYGEWSDVRTFTVTAISSSAANDVKYPFELVYIASDSDYWSYSFKQFRNIDMDGADDFTPIGNYNSSSSRFRGSYDGGGYTISNLSIYSTEDYQGMFGCTYSGATLTDIHLEDVNISGGTYVGGLVGRLYGTVKYCSVEGKITATGEYTGGLAGYTEYSSISECYSKCTVEGNNYVGGFEGYSRSVSHDACYSIGTIKTTNTNGIIGGFAGICTRRASNYVNATYTDCFSASTLTDIDTAYGFGYHSHSTVSDCFYDSTLFTGSESKAAPQYSLYMKIESIFIDAGWDFADEDTNGTEYIWDRADTINGGYPYLVNNPPALE